MKTQHCPASHDSRFQLAVHETPMLGDLMPESMPGASSRKKKKKKRIVIH